MLPNFALLQLFSDYSASRDVRVVSEVEGERSSLHCGFIEEALHTMNKPERGSLFDVVISLVVQIVALVVVVATGTGRVSCPSLNLSCQNESEAIASIRHWVATCN